MLSLSIRINICAPELNPWSFSFSHSGVKPIISATMSLSMTHCKAQWYHTLHVSATSHRCCDLARDPHSQTLTITVDVKCPVLNTAWAQGLMVQSKILVLPPMRAGNSDGSGDLPAHSAPLALPQPKAAPKSLLNKPTSAFVLSLVLQKSALVFQATLATL